jgi:actin-related protein
MAACEPDLKSQLLQNVVLTGGGSLLVGFAERLNNELNKQWPGVREGFRTIGFLTYLQTRKSN